MSTNTTMLLHDGIANARYQLERAVPAYAAGELAEVHHPHAIGVLFRKLGVCRLLTTGQARPLWQAQMQSASAYLHRLPQMSDEHKVTSWAGVLWDAIGGGYWGAAAEIARHSRPTLNPEWEHEDDFLYVWFLLTRYFFEHGLGRGIDEQHIVLDRWASVLAGAYDPRRDLCVALVHRDPPAVHAALEQMSDARDQSLLEQLRGGRLAEDDAAWSRPLWPEGLALVRLIEHEGIEVDAHLWGVPQILRGASPLAYEVHAWRSP